MALLNQMGSYFGIGAESDEDRRRREEEERLKAEQEATPFKQTIVTDPVTGKQTMKMEGAVEDFSAANPNTPTVVGPAVPGEMGPPRSAMPEQPGFFGELYNARMNDLNKRVDQTVGMFQDPEAYARERFAGVTQAVDDPAAYARQRLGMTPTAPTAPAESPVTYSDIRGQEVDMQSQVGGAPTTTAAAPAVPTDTNAPAKSKAVLAAEQLKTPATTAPTADGLAMGPSIADAQPEAWESKIQAAKSNPQALAAINSDSRAPDWAKSLAAEELGSVFSRQQKEKQQEQKLNTIVQNQGKGFERAIKDPSEEGSIFRAYLYARFGLNDLAKAEQEKLGANDQYQAADIDGVSAVIKYGANGQAKSGVYTSGDMAGQAISSQDLSKAVSGRALGKGASLSSEVYVDKNTGQRYRSGYDNTGKAALVNIQGGPSFKGNPKDLEVQSISTSIAKAEGAKAVDLRYTGPIAYTKAGADFIGKFNAENGTNLGYASQTPGAPLIDRNTGQTITPGSGGTIRATTTATTTGGGGATQTTATPTKILEAPKYRSPGYENESPAAFEARQKNWAEANKPLAKKEQNNQYFANETYGLIQPIADLIKKSTGSGIGAGVDKLANLIGASPSGAQAIDELNVLSYSIEANVPRFEGAQSDRDVAIYRKAAGDLNNPDKPIKQRLAALNAIVTLLKKYDKDKTNDWSFSSEAGEVDRSNPLLNKKK